MSNIRPAVPADLARIAEIEVFNYRMNFYPSFAVMHSTLTK